MPERLLYTVKDAASLLSLSRAKLYELLARGEIASFKLDGLRRIPRSALIAFIERAAEREREGTHARAK